MRLRARVDRNQKQIVKALRDRGIIVQHTHELGKGVFDLVAADEKKMVWIEIKDGAKSASQKRLTPDEELFYKKWKRHAVIVESVDEALKVFGLSQKRTSRTKKYKS